jgi:hypothetical protein
VDRRRHTEGKGSETRKGGVKDEDEAVWTFSDRLGAYLSTLSKEPRATVKWRGGFGERLRLCFSGHM